MLRGIRTFVCARTPRARGFLTLTTTTHYSFIGAIVGSGRQEHCCLLRNPFKSSCLQLHCQGFCTLVLDYEQFSNRIDLMYIFTIIHGIMLWSHKMHKPPCIRVICSAVCVCIYWWQCTRATIVQWLHSRHYNIMASSSLGNSSTASVQVPV